MRTACAVYFTSRDFPIAFPVGRVLCLAWNLYVVAVLASKALGY